MFCSDVKRIKCSILYIIFRKKETLLNSHYVLILFIALTHYPFYSRDYIQRFIISTAAFPIEKTAVFNDSCWNYQTFLLFFLQCETLCLSLHLWWNATINCMIMVCKFHYQDRNHGDLSLALFGLTCAAFKHYYKKCGLKG